MVGERKLLILEGASRRWSTDTLEAGRKGKAQSAAKGVSRTRLDAKIDWRRPRIGWDRMSWTRHGNVVGGRRRGLNDGPQKRAGLQGTGRGEVMNGGLGGWCA